jgi:hypothetical protein
VIAKGSNRAAKGRGEVSLMENAPYSSAFRYASHVVLLLMAAAIVYSGAMAIIHWTGIGV